MYLTQKKYQNKLNKDYEYLLLDPLISNLCLVKKLNKAGNLYIDHITFNFWQGTTSLNFNIYLNEDNLTYTIKSGDLIIDNKIEITNLSKDLSKCKFFLKFKSQSFTQDKTVITKVIKKKR